jgi:hypothetical protein
MLAMLMFVPYRRIFAALRDGQTGSRLLGLCILGLRILIIDRIARQFVSCSEDRSSSVFSLTARRANRAIGVLLARPNGS